MSKATASLSEIQKGATTAVAKSLTASTDERTALLRDAARLFVDARAHFYTREGEPDWLGRTYAYRTWVREVMSDAHVPSDTLTSLQASIRYHTGNILRERLDSDTLDDLGLQKSSPRERSVEKRLRDSALLNVFSGAELASVEAVRQACELIEAALARVNITGLPAKERREASAALKRVAERAGELATMTK
jgi:hypothetical protein